MCTNVFVGVLYVFMNGVCINEWSYSGECHLYMCLCGVLIGVCGLPYGCTTVSGGCARVLDLTGVPSVGSRWGPAALLRPWEATSVRSSTLEFKVDSQNH